MSQIARTDVTAVKLFNDFIVAGIGSYLNIYNRENSTLLQRLKVLNGQKIYGLVPDPRSLRNIVFGGKQFSVIEPCSVGGSSSPSDQTSLFDLSFEPVVCDDWIHSGIWIDDDTIAVLTAHNVVQTWNISTQRLIAEIKSKDNSILYSGLLVPLINDVLVFAGTVFSEVIVHICGEEHPIHQLKGHRGVIFSISCKPEKNIITTTSDDRSVRIWTVVSSNTNKYNKEYWKNCRINFTHEIYGHTARVMRSCITNTIIISVGEDSNICFWDYKGNLLRKVSSHQNGCIWAVDVDEESVLTGGGDCGVTLHPLTIASEYGHHETIDITVIPKKIIFTARRNIVILSENDEVMFYDCDLKHSSVVCKLNHESTYKLVSLSSCKQIIAIADMNGCLNVFTENCKGEPSIKMIVDEKINISKILSMQWAGNRHLVLCSDNGLISVIAANGSKIEEWAHFILPKCKERWLTAACIDCSTNSVVVGDRCGNIHVYVQGKNEPVKSFSKVHGRYGPTTITIVNKSIISTGRDGTIKMFLVTTEYGLLKSVKYLSAKNLEFAWAEKFLDRNNNIICGFQERVFVVYNINDGNKLLEVPCGGGHRSWDAMRYFDKRKNTHEEFIDFIYTKNSDVHYSTFQMSKIASKIIVNGTHCKEINCLKFISCKNNRKLQYLISGGEDTTLRITKLHTEMNTSDHIVSKHLSSIRALKSLSVNDGNLIISAGGRAQLCVDKIIFNEENNEVLSEQIIDYLIKGKDKERRNNQNWRNYTIDFDPETRIMDVEVIQTDEDTFTIFAGCSDVLLRVFKLRISGHEITPVAEIKHHNTCILKCHQINLTSKKILVTCTTRGVGAFWDISDTSLINHETEPIFVTNFNKSGINSIVSRILSNNSVLIATGGDDNAIHIKLLNIEILESTNTIDIRVVDSWNSDKFHCSQITGLVYVDDMLMSCSIDQRITLLRWIAVDGRISCEFVSQSYSDVADIQGMELIENSSDWASVCVFGKGMEIIKVSKTGSKEVSQARC